ncbi:MAG TPA: hypothetical protein PKA61_08775, partial [Nitrospira sp.]|nr:hypothetical protein [Nitrospira sp.]
TVVGRIILAAVGPVDVFLKGNFKADIAGEIIEFRNPRFEEDDTAAQVIGDMENPQIGTVNLISFDPHPNLVPHPYVEWFSGRSNHYRFELEPGDAWVVTEERRATIDGQSRAIREALADRVVDRPRSEEESEWI